MLFHLPRNLCLISCLILSISCRSNPDGVPSSGYPFTSESSRVFSEIAKLFETGYLGDVKRISLSDLDKLKSQNVKEFYFSEQSVHNENGMKILIGQESTILALIGNGKNRYEIWQVWPIPARISYHSSRDADKALFLRPPFPYDRE